MDPKNSNNIKNDQSDKDDGIDIQEQINNLSGDVSKSAINKESSANVQGTKSIKKEISLQDNAEESLDNTETDKIVEDIIKEEGDIVIKAHDEKVYQYNKPPEKSNIFKRFFGTWFHNKYARWLTIILIFGGLAGIFIYPTSRYEILNKFGVKASMSIQVVDSKSGLPVKNVEAVVQDQKQQTDDNGNATFYNLTLGPTDLLFTKRSFAPETVNVVIGFGSNPYNSPFEITPTGTTFKYTVLDWLTTKPIVGATVSDGESEALTNEQGEAELTIEPTDSDIVTSVSAEMYSSKSVTIPSDSEAPQQILLVPSKKDIFLSNRSGKISVFDRKVDGSEETILLAGTGNEQDSTQLIPHPNKDIAVLLSSRDGKRDDKGNILSALYTINANNKQVEQINDSVSSVIKLVGWSGDNIIYILGGGASVESPLDQQKLVVYNTSSEQVKELAKSAYFGDVKIADNSIYYVTSALDQAQTGAGLSVINVDGSQQKIIIDMPVWSVNRADQENLIVNVQDDKWYQVNTKNNEAKNLEGKPPLIKDYQYVKSPYDSSVIYVDTRDGKGALLLSDGSLQDKSTQEITRQSGLLSLPLRWVTPTSVLYSVSNPQESANYIVDKQEKKAQKIGDVTNLTTSVYR